MSADHLHIDTVRVLQVLDESDWENWGGTISGEYSDWVLEEWTHLSDVDCEIFYGPDEPYNFLSEPKAVEYNQESDTEVRVLNVEDAWKLRSPRNAFELLRVSLGQPRYDWTQIDDMGPNFLSSQLEIIYDTENIDIQEVGEAINRHSPDTDIFEDYLTSEPDYSNISERVQRIEENEELFDGIRNERPLYGGISINGPMLSIYSPDDFEKQKFQDDLSTLKKTGKQIVRDLNNISV